MAQHWVGDDPYKWAVYKAGGKWWAQPPLRLSHNGWKPFGFSTQAIAFGFAVVCSYSIAPFSQTYRVG